MLPLFGRTRKTAAAAAVINVEAINDEWCVPSDQELYGRSKTEQVKLETVTETEIVPDKSIDTFVVTDDTQNDMDTTEDIDTNVDNGNSVSFQSVNNGEADVVMVESEITFSSIADDTFSIMNNETSILSVSESLDTHFPSQFAFKTVLERLVALERKYEELNEKCTKMEQEQCDQKGNQNDSNSSIFVNEFIDLMQNVMKSGLDYQQRILGKFIDELDGMFDIDFTNFDPLK